ncbi:2677_t:CDS:1, partial [Racocetra fulgida]
KTSKNINKEKDNIKEKKKVIKENIDKMNKDNIKEVKNDKEEQ